MGPICKLYTSRSKASSSLSEVSPAQIESSLELLIKIKPKLKDIQTNDGSVVQDLHQITSLAQSFSELRLKSSKKSHLADALDQEGLCRWLLLASVAVNIRLDSSKA
ncbi:hypothetical protein BS17DRAFT_771925 [Gyrodon lividus]|nr:hypothetical protein BS17DRAFT_771925 [Gyrodon lividus]